MGVSPVTAGSTRRWNLDISTASRTVVRGAQAHEAPGTKLVFEVRLNRASTKRVRVNYRTRNGTATAGADYVAKSGTIAFAPGQTVKSVEVTVLDDAHDESPETVVFKLSRARNARMDRHNQKVKGVITNTDAMPQAWLALLSVDYGEKLPPAAAPGPEETDT